MGTILGSVRLGKTTYKAGDEEAFAAAASQGQIKHLLKKGAIEGDFTSGKKASKSDEPAAEAGTDSEAVEEDSSAAEEETPKGKGKGKK